MLRCKPCYTWRHESYPKESPLQKQESSLFLNPGLSPERQTAQELGRHIEKGFTPLMGRLSPRSESVKQFFRAL